MSTARRLPTPRCLRFPLRIGAGGPAASTLADHVREQIEQVLFTSPGERVMRPEFGGGLRALVFEPNSAPLWELTRKRLLAALAEALQGEVDPRTLAVSVDDDGGSGAAEGRLVVRVNYRLAAIGEHGEQRFLLSAGGSSSPGDGSDG